MQIFFPLPGRPCFSLLNENHLLLIHSIRRLLAGSIFAGFLLSNTILPATIPQITMPPYSKPTVLAVTISGFILALEINHTTPKSKVELSFKPLQILSNLLGYFPMILHRLLPSSNFSDSQKSVSSLLTTTCLQNHLS